DPYELVQAETTNIAAGIEYVSTDGQIVASGNKGSWTCVIGADFGDGASAINICAKGKGVIEVRLDNQLNDPSADLRFDSDSEYTNVKVEFKDKVSGVHNIFFIFGEDNISMDSWQAVK
ncbi:MAG: hypothetical protein J1D89_06360, partial [Agathobacter sp.]|nr:hypothetical protein [Agathobacter sp.]